MKKEIGEYIKILSGYPFNSDLFNEENIGKPLIRIRDLERSYSKTYFNGEYEKTYVISQGDILVGMDGDFNAVKWKGIDSLLNQRICKIETEENSLDKEFMYQSLQSELNKIHRKTAATTVKHLSTKDIKKIKIFFPPLEEQKKIADILSTVDKKIAFVEENINATEELKKGLMQKLLTEGIGHKEFKDSELGRIPESWTIQELNDISEVTRLAGYEYSEYWEESESGDIIALKGYNIGKGKIINKNLYYISKELSEQLNRSKLYAGDIVFPCVGTIGNAVAIRENDKYHINQNIAKITPKANLNSDYLVQYLMSYLCRKEIFRFNATTSQPNVLVGSLRKFRVPFPTLEEQKQIAEILSTVDNKLENLKEKKQYFEELKKGLMQKLLTGEVRV